MRKRKVLAKLKCIIKTVTFEWAIKADADTSGSLLAAPTTVRVLHTQWTPTVLRAGRRTGLGRVSDDTPAHTRCTDQRQEAGRKTSPQALAPDALVPTPIATCNKTVQWLHTTHHRIACVCSWVLDNTIKVLWVGGVIRGLKCRFTRYDFVAYNLLTTHLRHFLGHDCRKVLKHGLKSYNFFSCREGRCMRQNRP